MISSQPLAGTPAALRAGNTGITEILHPGHDRLKDHPFAGLFDLLSARELADLSENIAAYGQHEPVMIHRNMILDGRNRYRACRLKGLPVRYEQFPGTNDEALDYVVSKNVYRRHLSSSQRALAMASYEEYRHGGRRRNLVFQDADLRADGIEAAKPAPTRAELAERGHVSERLINSAATVRDHGAPELNDAVRKGDIAASTAEQIAQRPLEQQMAILESLPRDGQGKLTPEAKKALAPVIKEIRAERQTEKKERRDTREAELGRKILAMPDKKYGVAIEDFEWDHEPWSRESGMDRHPSNHYPTAADAHTPEEIVARTAERFKCLADDCVLYMWTTIPHEAIAHKVLELRGFKYVSQRIWDKLRAGDGRGPGYWVTGEHEILLIAVRGNVVAPATAHFRSRFEAPVGAHSEKPDQQYEHAEYHFPNIPKIELNARRSRPGWQPWGYEAPLPTAESGAERAVRPGPIRVDDDDYEFPSCLKRKADNVPPFARPSERQP
jgi:N6-adenosine-specific RNA methylase IME4/ParB-like chromosome segregation protein Spo0J